MGNYFLASVGNAEAFAKRDGKLVQVISARTLTDSSISISSTMEDVRAGQGAKLYGRFNHDTGMTVQLTDAMFNLDYVALQVGSLVTAKDSVMFSEQLEYDAEAGFKPSKTPVAMGKSAGLNHIGIWCRPLNDLNKIPVFVEKDADGNFKAKGMEPGQYCVTYFRTENDARSLLINANFVPAEMILLLTAKLFAGDASAPETGKPVGEITFKFPRFQLDGAFDLSLAMSSAATLSLNGTVLASDAAGCDGEGIYAEVVEYIQGRTNEAIAISFADGELAIADLPKGTILQVYGITADGFTYEMDNAELTFDPGTTNAVVTGGIIKTEPSAAGEITATKGKLKAILSVISE